MSDLLKLPVSEFLAAVAARQPAPGGGSVAALCGALAASLGAMALEYTVGKKAFAAHDAELRAALAQFRNASAMFQELLAEDAAAYENLSQFLKMPEAARLADPAYLPAVVAAIRAPQAATGFAINLLERCCSLVDKTNPHLLSDLAIAAIYARATVHASELNVRINLPLLPNQQEATALGQSLTALSAKADGLAQEFRLALIQKSAALL